MKLFGVMINQFNYNWTFRLWNNFCKSVDRPKKQDALILPIYGAPVSFITH